MVQESVPCEAGLLLLLSSLRDLEASIRLPMLKYVSKFEALSPFPGSEGGGGVGVGGGVGLGVGVGFGAGAGAGSGFGAGALGPHA